MQQLTLFNTSESAQSRPYETSLMEVAQKMAHQLWAGQKLNPKQVRTWMTTAFGGSDAEGRWQWKDAYEAIEAAWVLLLGQHKTLLHGSVAEVLQQLALIENLGLTHSKRSEESAVLQQYSTPLQLAYLASLCAQIQARDVVLEPSAGTGILARFAQNQGATIILNELSKNRNRILRKLFGGTTVSSFNAEQIDDYLPPEIQPTVVIMNPPFTASPLRQRRNPQALGKHARSALMRLAPGGRLVLISAHWFCPGRKEWEQAFRGISEVRVGLTAWIDKAVYAKQGASIETRLTVIDKVPAEGKEVPTFNLRLSQTIGTSKTFSPHEVEKILSALPARRGGHGDRETGRRGDGETGGLGDGLTAGTSHSLEISRASGKRKSTSKPGKESQPTEAPNQEDIPETPSPTPISYTLKETESFSQPMKETLYEVYQPQRIAIKGAKAHPTTLCESSALSSVKPPAVSYQPLLSRTIVEKGRLSEVQLESVIYAGEAHSHQLNGYYLINETWEQGQVTSSDNGQAVRIRQGWFLGDGTGAGKGRQIAGIILDNWNRGRTKALWLSKSDKLIEDAKRDWTALGGNEAYIIALSKYKLGETISQPRGILFTTYATLRGEKPRKKSRLEQIIEWVGRDFEGVIAFDESHAMGNAIAEAGERGIKSASQQGLAGLRLQNALPQARVVYVSATGASKVSNLAYATRLGLWQTEDFPFASRTEFISSIQSGGVAAMEVISRDLKALGLYFARNLSFEGVEYEALETPLTREQIKIYDAYAQAFEVIHNHLEEALKACNIVGVDGKTQNRHAKMAAKAMFESHKQRFFNHLISAMKCPALIRSIEEDIQQGRAVVIQIVSTNEELLKRQLAQIPVEAWNDLNIDITPREYVMDYLVHAFPIHLYESYETSEGDIRAQLVQDEEGNPVVCQEAVQQRDKLVEKLASLPPVPGALDQLLHHFGHEAVAEVTGRSQRILCEAETGRLFVANRPASANLEEAQQFMNDEKRILIFSDAGGTGRSYHADRDAQNNRRRVHYLLEAGWRADNAIQGLGRSHRTNQESAPIFRPVITDVRGERRFISTIARRLDALGALTRGQRQTGGQGLFDPKDNLESTLASAALRQLFVWVYKGQVTACRVGEFEAATGLSLTDSSGQLKETLPNIRTFLNRILALRIELQNNLFEAFEMLLTAKIEAAMEAGIYDLGVETLRAQRFSVVSRETIYTHPTGGETVCIEIEKWEKNPILSSQEALLLSRSGQGKLLVNKRSGRSAVSIPTSSTVNSQGGIVERLALVRPTEHSKVPIAELESSNWHSVRQQYWQQIWDEEVGNTPPFVKSRFFLISGLLLPIWKCLDSSNMRVFRLQTETGERLLGRMIEPETMASVAQALGLRHVKLLPAEIYRQVMETRQRYQLAGGFSLCASSVMGEVRLEIAGTHIGEGLCEQLKGAGCFTEIIAYRRRVFVPANEREGVEVIGKIILLLR